MNKPIRKREKNETGNKEGGGKTAEEGEDGGFFSLLKLKNYMWLLLDTSASDSDLDTDKVKSVLFMQVYTIQIRDTKKQLYHFLF